VRLPSRARLVRIPLEGSIEAAGLALLLRGDSHPVALAGAWAGGGGLAASEPIAVAAPDEDPFKLLDRMPELDGASGADAVGGGWFGYLGYRLGGRVERVPPSARRPERLPDFALAFYDHVLRVDAGGRLWFEALWSSERERELNERLELLRTRVAAGAPARDVWVGPVEVAPPGAAGHVEAVAEGRERIAAGEIFQANLCLRLEGRWHGDPVDLFARTAGALAPRHAALVAGPWGAVCSLSPELFLRRRGRDVVSEPIKGTAPNDPEALIESAKDRAENVMIVDLMRNDLGRVCEYGSVHVPALTEPRRAPGVWHLVSEVAGTLREGVGDADLLRATFPPGSVTGAPKIQTMRVIAELEATGREAYTGAIGYASPAAGLELNVAIRTLEMRGERIWMGAGGGIVADSDPVGELDEALAKARPVIAAAGGRLAEPVREGRAWLPPVAFATGGADRPDPELGVFSTLLARDGIAERAATHLARLGASAEELYGEALPPDLPERLAEAASAVRLARLRVLVVPGRDLEIETQPLRALPGPAPVALAPVTMPGGLGAHKWLDRRLLAELDVRLGAVPLLVDLDGEVLEAAFANIWVVEGGRLVTPPLDGRILPGVIRSALTARPPAGMEVREEPISLDRLHAGDGLFLTSSIRGAYGASIGRASKASRSTLAAVREALERSPAPVHGA
jgi:para-aminobenzoate synthetase/4-amino-4-deoxychorismate lyase